ncbi:porphobilinogen synthase [Corynebacterium glutamicum MB001]|uniref:Delta-aminolevulinic acid dehydratase n=1 Tax=Corynebacterium glutamicum (strain ATCC 13032 / DSM 20300 / JCM 1318 / BCRC 11384 / CCUG 27702 / LMG 3730 / NBRC 12168 / NCIMB 10025 / NRRL B-2784 / 534) TaxID=196627 RepID=Q8NT79_CORGL|nr:porphobilinogen synthase [Corynebacterium glutamicum]AGT04438.1 porphobilinogen synthase [Corynebacterium glutamicum MB001]AIK84165.1 delta-aminolevulinic acid dehydratase [Corynebacterium glutamicum]AIK86949.1 delta-aminolevulinic acid dehydratase [Corynebacterium glutamicum]ALZ99207.1 delta-aminolevulinic acid dehydratase [Corynebacterium glutamicum]ARV65338.1 delta-aminolevulinic acid dehydratase [Corynebacterium glutamicum]
MSTSSDYSHALIRRPRRLRANPAMRELVAETALRPADLILPMFFADGITEAREISSMPGVYQHTEDSLLRAAHEALDAGVRCVDLFGVPVDADKDFNGSQAWSETGVLNRALSSLRKEFGDDLLIMADTCLDEFTDHGHCGVVTEDRHGNAIVDNDATLPLYQQMAVAQARAGAHIVSPSGMMDGQIAAIRAALDEEGYQDVAIMAYSAKYASAFFGPFREAVGSSLQGDRRTYQQDPANLRESLLEAELDIAEGADFIMVKPALPYLDVLTRIADTSPVPVAAYQVSGEYAMIQAAGRNGWVDLDAVMMESLTSIKRAGANQILTYFAVDAARALRNA